MLKVLYLGYVWPEPASSAAGGRTLSLLRLFRAQQCDVVFASAAGESLFRADLAALGVREQTIKLNCDSFDVFVQAYQPDVVVFDRFFTEEQFAWRVEKHCPQALRVLDTCDFHSLRDARERLLKRAKHAQGDAHTLVLPDALNSASLIPVMLQDDLCLRELAAFYRCDLNLMISQFEVDLLVQHFHLPSRLFQLSHLMQVSSSQGATPTFEERQHFISIGNFRHAPNWDAVLVLKQQIWPRLRQRLLAQGLRDVQLHVYGAYMPPKASALHQEKEGFMVYGRAQDALEVMRQARVCLAPLRFGAGMKGKLADAMRAGTPSVTTSIGAEGMLTDTAWPGAIADDPDTFVDAALRLYTDAKQFALAQQNAAPLLLAYHDEAHNAAALWKVLIEAKAQQAQGRAANLTGQLLRHHSMKSSQYLSQWIQLKNKVSINPATST